MYRLCGFKTSRLSVKTQTGVGYHSRRLHDVNLQSFQHYPAGRAQTFCRPNRGVAVVSHGLVGECAFGGGSLLLIAARPRDRCRFANQSAAID